MSFYSVRPRYSAGSPASVSREICEHVAEQEKEGYEHALSGIYGERQKRRAMALGLRGICVYKRDRSSGPNRGKWEVADLVTGEEYTLPILSGRRRRGQYAFRPFERQGGWVVGLVEKDRESWTLYPELGFYDTEMAAWSVAKSYNDSMGLDDREVRLATCRAKPEAML
jgi:hypothetical protein